MAFRREAGSIGAALIFIAALLYSAVGHAGASGYLAVMAFLGTAPSSMRPAALVLNLLVAAIGTVQFARAGYFRWSLFWPFALGSVPAAYLGGRLALPGNWYRVIVGVVLLLSALRFVITLRADDTVRREAPRPLAFVAGCFLGLLSGLTGVGGGIFLSPLLLMAGWADLRTTAATSAAFILVNSAAGLLGQGAHLDALPTPIVLWAIAAVLGGIIGSQLGSRRLGGAALRGTLATVLVVAGVKLILR
ncbi:MAG: sulfite exporter TauE/SafE family protein [Gemmatimonadota bacterium]